MYDLKKKGGLLRDERRMEMFREALEFCELIDVGYSNRWFTWERGNLTETNIQEHLDRGAANENWISMFPEVNVQHLVHSFSDHCPLLIDTNKEDKRRTKSHFKFEAWWILKDSIVDEAKYIWKTASGDFLKKLEILKKGLENWARQMRRNKQWKKEFLTTKLSKLIETERDDINLAEMIDTKIQLHFEIEKDERYWEQRARLNWLKVEIQLFSIAKQRRGGGRI
ncbi:hypothetical protein Golax_025444 [Gossypium laxum]|uniref:Reverse transcriptase n=1 Tax=Gossypium laxum TaxID=34288 RepID=A0A7J9B1Q0_9ROSI|nr:hypothetical protein [Gossypium laxum]